MRAKRKRKDFDRPTTLLFFDKKSFPSAFAFVENPEYNETILLSDCKKSYARHFRRTASVLRGGWGVRILLKANNKFFSRHYTDSLDNKELFVVPEETVKKYIRWRV